MRRQPLAPEHVEQAAALYRYGFSIAAIASYLDASYNNVRQNFVRLGIERRPRGGSQPVSGRVNHSTLDEQKAWPRSSSISQVARLKQHLYLKRGSFAAAALLGFRDESAVPPTVEK